MVFSCVLEGLFTTDNVKSTVKRGNIDECIAEGVRQMGREQLPETIVTIHENDRVNWKLTEQMRAEFAKTI